MFENLLESLKAQALEPYKPLLDAGYSIEDICQWKTTSQVIAHLMDASGEITHLTEHHDDLVAAKLDLAIADYLEARIDAVNTMHEIMGKSAPVEAIRGFAREARKIYDDLAKKLQDRRDLEASLNVH